MFEKKLKGVVLLLLAASLWCGATPLMMADETAPLVKTRLVVLTDIGNEPDDSESFVRLLTYSNEFDIEKIVATTSTWQRDKVQPALLRQRVEGYAKVYPNLIKHAKGFPKPEQLRRNIIAGRSGYGMAFVGEGKSTDASRAITAIVDKPDARPVWIGVWGGAVDLAQALWDVRNTRTPAAVARFVGKIRVYSISDQDNTGVWIRRNFPTMRWISSLHAYNDYWLSTWIGISAPIAAGGDMTQVQNAWLRQHIQLGPLGKLYPDVEYIMEGDSPSFLYLLQNGLNVPEHPEYGGWGGRYAPVAPDDISGLRVSSSDQVRGVDGNMYKNASASIWRFRHPFQNDFAGRIQWTLTNKFSDANHNPIVLLNGKKGSKPLRLQVKSGAQVVLSAQGSRDPDGDALSFLWWQYAEPTATALQVHFAPQLALTDTTQQQLRFRAPEVAQATPFHIILEVHDDGKPELYRYRRAIVTVVPTTK